MLMFKMLLLTDQLGICSHHKVDRDTHLLETILHFSMRKSMGVICRITAGINNLNPIQILH